VHHEEPERQEIERELGDRYQIVRVLGRGAFGAVYLARERQLHRLVAIKALHAERAWSDDERAGLLREARTVANLSHPAIVPLLGFGETTNTVYMVMPYVSGETLAGRLARGDQFTADEVRRILIEVADALAYAHGEGVLHQDLKPENVFLERAGAVGDDDVPPRVRLIDFGVAAFPGRDAGVGARSEAWGTPHFMAPEQAFGEPALDARSDLYSLGVLGFLLLGGRLPFEASSPTERLTQQRKGPVVPLSVCAPGAPDDLVAAIERCLAFDPEQRWRRARDLRQTLMRGVPAAASPMAVIRHRLRHRVRPVVDRPRHHGSGPGAFFGIGADLRYALRTLGKTPGFTAAIVAILAIGLGATTVVFSAVEALVLRKLPVPNPEALVVLQEQREGPNQSSEIGMSTFRFDRYLAYREPVSAVLSGLAAHTTVTFAVRLGDGARTVNGMVTSTNYFDVLGLRPAIGRFYRGPDERSENGGQIAVVSHAFWQASLGGDPAVIGRTLFVDSRPLTVIGIAPAGFGGVLGGIFPFDLWVPAVAYGTASTTRWMLMFGRLRPGVDMVAASAALRVIAPRVPTEDARTRIVDARVEGMGIIPGRLRGPVANFTMMLLAISGLVLLIAATNAAGMLLARATIRRREVATRLAIGASRGRVVRQLLVESLVLCVAAAITGVLLAFWLARLLNAWQLPVPLPVAVGLGVNRTVLGAAAVAMLGACLIAGLVPALQATGVDLAVAMKEGGTRGGTRRARTRSAFVIAQVAMSVVLLAGAGLFVRALQRALAVDPGFEASNVITTGVNLSSQTYDRERAMTLLARLTERLRARSEIAGASLAYAAPLSGSTQRWGARRVDQTDDSEVEARWGVADVGFLEVLRVPMLAGRTFAAADAGGAPNATVINQTLANRLWPGERLANVLGRELTIARTRASVVGVMANGKYGSLNEGPTAYAYLALAQRPASPALYVRTRGDVAAGLNAIRAELAELDPNAALSRPRRVLDDVQRSLLPQRLGALVVGIFGVVGLVLAVTGLYGVLAYGVTQRLREFGVRMALGAQPGDVVGLVVRQGLRLVAVGVVVGMAGALVAGRVLASFLFGVSPGDPITAAAVPIVLAVAALVACVVPARRAVAADPMAALRAE
jgi:predicted permease